MPDSENCFLSDLLDCIVSSLGVEGDLTVTQTADWLKKSNEKEAGAIISVKLHFTLNRSHRCTLLYRSWKCSNNENNGERLP